MSLTNLTIAEAAEGLKKKKFSSVELTTDYLRRIEEKNPQLNAFITISKETALIEAQKADQRLKKGKASILCGIPFSVKDAICTADVRSTGAAKILDNYIPPLDATVIGKIRSAGGVLLGKNNCDTFGHGASNENSMYGPVRNPHDETKVAGGSSGGSAAAVAADLSVYSIAEDTGGSIRQPASFCGIVGLRPSYGRNSRSGIMPMASSLDTVGPMAKTVEDVAILLEAMAGHDPKDATTVREAVPEYTKAIKKRKKKYRLGVPKEYLDLPGMHTDVRALTEKCLKALEAAGAELVEVSLPHTKYSIPTYYTIVPCEDSSNLARLDGIRYGTRVTGDNLYSVYTRSRAAGFPPEVKRRIMMGTYALSAGYYDAYYRKAQKVRTLIIRDFTDVFRDVDALVTPTSPFPAFALGERAADILAMYAADVFVSPAAVAGIPAISVPMGFTGDKLPVGLQVIGPRLGEEVVLQVGALVESLT